LFFLYKRATSLNSKLRLHIKAPKTEEILLQATAVSPSYAGLAACGTTNMGGQIVASPIYTLVSDNYSTEKHNSACTCQHNSLLEAYPRVTRGNNRRRSTLAEIRHEHGIYTKLHTAGGKKNPCQVRARSYNNNNNNNNNNVH